MGAINYEKARFDTRLTKEQKQLFEQAAVLGGYRSLTDFILDTVQRKAKEIIEEREKVIISEKDKAIFFETILNPPKPNNDLIAAKHAYEKKLSE